MTTDLQDLHQIVKDIELKAAFSYCKEQGINIDFCTVSPLRFEIAIRLFAILGFDTPYLYLASKPLEKLYDTYHQDTAIIPTSSFLQPANAKYIHELLQASRHRKKSIYYLYESKADLPLEVYQNVTFIIFATSDADIIHISLNHNKIIANYWSFPLNKDSIDPAEIEIFSDMSLKL